MIPATSRVVARAYAKVNLDLRVLGTRADGYHELRTVFQTIEMHDTLVCAGRPGPFEITCHMSGVPVDESNLIWKAAARLWDALGRSGPPADAAIALEKVIPFQAGLGGGSADAAAALRALARLWGGAPLPLLREVGRRPRRRRALLPVRRHGARAGARRGNLPARRPAIPPVVIVRPPFGVSTAEAYAWYDEDKAAGLRESRELQMLPVPWPTRAAQMINDLEPPVVRRHPEIVALRQALREAGAIAAAMSGSGSSVFGLFRSRVTAAKVLKPLSKGGAQAILTRTLSRGEFERRSKPTIRRHA